MRPTTRHILTLALAGGLLTSVAHADLPPESLGGAAGTFDIGTGGFSGTYNTYGGSAGTYNDPYAGYAGYAGTYTTIGGNGGTYPGSNVGGSSTVVVNCGPTGTAGNVSTGGTSAGAIAGSSGAGTTGSGNAAGADLGTGNPSNPPGVCGPVVGSDPGGHKCAVSTPGDGSGSQGTMVGLMLMVGLGALWLERRRR